MPDAHAQIPPHRTRRIALVACSVMEDEIAMLTASAVPAPPAPPPLAEIISRRFHDIGLHDRPDVLRTTLQADIDELSAAPSTERPDAIVFVYGLCGLGTDGLMARDIPLVIPRAHDCITFFFGSKERYAEHQARCPGCHYYTPGWNRARRVPGPDRIDKMRAELADRFEPDDIEFLIESEREHWTATGGPAVYLDLGTPAAATEADYARRCAEYLKWDYSHPAGDPALLRDLLTGHWDEQRFLIVPPGQRITHTVTTDILRAQPPPLQP
ncbi:DUF1638 domain-containing protein [Geminisphaera colitermitum]|uniref:DUF1638 domain-containing protein n=1 Tax=Geminisphaera colitermitum TaxID=1148786 RepID=UPI000158C8FF|nr:DUF1638 domain-containing protein [Geminisphaera colitermitum]